MAQRESPISRGMNRFRPAAMAANGTIQKKTRDAAHERLSSTQRCGLVAWRQQGDT